MGGRERWLTQHHPQHSPSQHFAGRYTDDCKSPDTGGKRNCERKGRHYYSQCSKGDARHLRQSAAGTSWRASSPDALGVRLTCEKQLHIITPAGFHSVSRDGLGRAVSARAGFPSTTIRTMRCLRRVRYNNIQFDTLRGRRVSSTWCSICRIDVVQKDTGPERGWRNI